jgi:hypothetical protein
VGSFTVPKRVALEICAEAVKAQSSNIRIRTMVIRKKAPIWGGLYHGAPAAANLEHGGAVR